MQFQYDLYKIFINNNKGTPMQSHKLYLKFDETELEQMRNIMSKIEMRSFMRYMKVVISMGNWALSEIDDGRAVGSVDTEGKLSIMNAYKDLDDDFLTRLFVEDGIWTDEEDD